MNGMDLLITLMVMVVIPIAVCCIWSGKFPPEQ